jgi:glycogen phosphorylase
MMTRRLSRFTALALCLTLGTDPALRSVAFPPPIVHLPSSVSVTTLLQKEALSTNPLTFFQYGRQYPSHPQLSTLGFGSKLLTRSQYGNMDAQVFVRKALQIFSKDLMHELPGQEELWYVVASHVRAVYRPDHHDAQLKEEFSRRPRWILRLVNELNLWDAIVADEEIIELLLREILAYHARTRRGDTWIERNEPEMKDVLIAYSTAEEGWGSLGTYGGGLGVLSANHTLGASDMGLNYVSGSLLYRQGYFRQLIRKGGKQDKEDRADIAKDQVSIEPAVWPGTTRELILDLPFPNRYNPEEQRRIHAKVWIARVGRVKKLLLDTDIPENTSHEDRNITDRLYHAQGGSFSRIEQYYLKGLGEDMAYAALGWEPDVFHVNDCHPAFLPIARIARQMKQLRQMDPHQDVETLFEAAFELVRTRTVFTTHTPIGAGNESVPIGTIIPFLREMFLQAVSDMDLTPEEQHRAVSYATNRILSIGVIDQDLGQLNLAALNIRMASRVNGVSLLHGQVSQRIWKYLYPGLEQDDVPIIGLTNAVHQGYFQVPEITALVKDAFQSEPVQYFMNHPDQLMQELRARTPEEALRWIDELIPVDPAELWRVHGLRKEMLKAEAIRRLKAQMAEPRFDATDQDLQKLESFDPQALTIGFARRYTAYKRGRLMFEDVEHLAAIAKRHHQPIQFYVAGKAHPDDDASKQIITDVISLISKLHDQGVDAKAVFVENYDVHLARFLESGVDIWLNNPIRPQEASGTSGMKASMNGVLNLSTSDGWCEEGIIHGVNGWLLGVMNGQHDIMDSVALYARLEKVMDLYGQRNASGVPVEFVRMMKASILVGVCQFGMQRMLADYVRKIYKPSYQAALKLTPERALRQAQAHRNEREKLLPKLQAIAATPIQIEPYPVFVPTDEDFLVEAVVDLKGLEPKAVGLDLHLIRKPTMQDEEPEHLWYGADGKWRKLPDGRYRYSMRLKLARRGDYDIEVRFTAQDQSIWQKTEERQSITRYEPGYSQIHVDDKDMLAFRTRPDNPEEGMLLYIHIPKDEASDNELVEDVFLASDKTGWVTTADGDPLRGEWQQFKLQPVRDGWWAIVVPARKWSAGRLNFRFYTYLKDGRYKWLNGTYSTEGENSYLHWDPSHPFASATNARRRLNRISAPKVNLLMQALMLLRDYPDSQRKLLQHGNVEHVFDDSAISVALRSVLRDGLGSVTPQEARRQFGEIGVKLLMRYIAVYLPDLLQSIAGWDPIEFESLLARAREDGVHHRRQEEFFTASILAYSIGCEIVSMESDGRLVIIRPSEPWTLRQRANLFNYLSLMPKFAREMRTDNPNVRLYAMDFQTLPDFKDLMISVNTEVRHPIENHDRSKVGAFVSWEEFHQHHLQSTNVPITGLERYGFLEDRDYGVLPFETILQNNGLWLGVPGVQFIRMRPINRDTQLSLEPQKEFGDGLGSANYLRRTWSSRMRIYTQEKDWGMMLKTLLVPLWLELLFRDVGHGLNRIFTTAPLAKPIFDTAA